MVKDLHWNIENKTYTYNINEYNTFKSCMYQVLDHLNKCTKVNMASK